MDETVWDTFFGSALHNAEPRPIPYRALLQEVIGKGARHTSIVVDFLDVLRELPSQVEGLLERPDVVMPLMEQAVERRAGARVTVRLTNLPDDTRLDVSQLREEHIGRLVSVRGIVQSVTETRPLFEDAALRCARCGRVIQHHQDDLFALQEPIECPEEQGGCGRKTAWLLLPRESSMVNMQSFTVQEPPELAHGAKTPERVSCYIFGDWCGRVMPSERVTVYGALAATVRKIRGQKTPVMDYHIVASSFRAERSTYEDIAPTPEEVVEIEKLSRDPDLIDKLVGSIAPSIHGRREVKLAILLQLFGGITKRLPDGQHKRGDVHILLVGDPGQGKSVLGRAAVEISPRAEFANLLTATRAGIVGGVEKMEKGLGGETWVYQSGLLTRVHKGMCFIDEADKAADEGLVHALLEPLEQQTVKLDKLGARGLVLPCEFSALIGANPKDGRFDMQADDLASQINLPSPLLDRMDLVFILNDEVDEARDASLVNTVLLGHQYGAALAARKNGRVSSISSEDLARAEAHLRPAIDSVFLRKYIAHARREFFPTPQESVRAQIVGKYSLVRSRRGKNPNAPVGYSVRTVDAFVRLAEASARMRLSNTIEEQDMDLAFEVYHAGWERLATNARGEIDTDRIGSAVPAGTRATMLRLRGIIAQLTEAHDDESGAREDEIMAAAVNDGITREGAMSALQRLKANGSLVPRKMGWFVATTPKEVRR